MANKELLIVITNNLYGCRKNLGMAKTIGNSYGGYTIPGIYSKLYGSKDIHFVFSISRLVKIQKPFNKLRMVMMFK